MNETCRNGAGKVARLVVVLTCAVLAGAVWSEGTWTSIGPWGGRVESLVIDSTNPLTIYASASGEVFKSTNGGRSWSAANSGLANNSTSRLAICARHPSTIYALSTTVVKTTDGGKRWTKTNLGLSGGLAIAADPHDPEVAYVGTMASLYKTSDGGTSWKILGGYVGGANAIAIDPKDPQTLFVGKYFQLAGPGGVEPPTSPPLYKSIDGGETWRAISEGLPVTIVTTLAVDPNDTSSVYVALGEGTEVFKSTDGGASWNPSNTGLPYGSWSAFAIHPSESAIVYAADGGIADPGSRSRIFKSTDGGARWSAVETGLLTDSVRALAIDPVDGHTLYAGTSEFGLLKSTNEGASWSSANAGIATESVASIAVNPTNPAAVLAGVDWRFKSAYRGGMLKTANGGASWVRQGGEGIEFVTEIAVDPTDSQTVYAASGCFGLSKTTNGGTTWKRIWEPAGLNDCFFMSALAMDPTNAKVLFAGSRYWSDMEATMRGVYKTTDGGVSWSATSAGLTSTSVEALVIDPADASTVYLGGSSGVFKSLDGGTSWSLAWFPDNKWTYVHALAIDPKSTQTLYAGVGLESGLPARVYKTIDGGATWFAVSTGLSARYVATLAIDPTETQTVYAGTDAGVFTTSNGGASWGALNNGLTNTSVMALAIDPGNPHRLYAGTDGGGVFVYGGLPPTSPTAWIPVVSHTAGFFDSSWRTDLALLNPGEEEARVTLTLHAPAPIAQARPSERQAGIDPVRIPGHSQVILTDVVDTLRFSGNAALEIDSDQPIRATSRTYTQIAPTASCYAKGTSGQSYRAWMSESGLREGESAWLPGLIETAAFRTNIFVTNTGADPALIVLALHSGDGTSLTTYPLALAPGEFHQETRPFSARARQTNLTRGYARVSVVSGQGIFASASVVDNLTNDPTTIAAVKTESGARLDSWVQIASHGNGVAGSTWRTDLGILNPNTSAANATVSFYAGGAVTSSSIVVPPGAQHMIVDVVGQIGAFGNGALRVIADRAVVVNSRTYSLVSATAVCTPAGTFGQSYDASHIAGLLASGQTGYLPLLRENASYRTNFSFTNTGNNPALVLVELFDGAGVPLTTFAVALVPGECKLETRPFAFRAGISDLDSGWARVTITRGDDVLVSASLVDNTTHDPSTIPAMQ